MSWLTDVCNRCNTTHPANDTGERACPAPPIEERPGPGMTFIPCVGMAAFNRRLPPIKVNGERYQP